LVTLLSIGVVAIVIVWWLLHLKNDAPRVPFAKVTRSTLISILPTNGKVEPIAWQAVRAQDSGLVEKVPVHEGMWVNRGDVLAVVQQTGLQADLDAAQARVAQARAELATVEAGGKAAELVEIENSLARYKLTRDDAQREYASLQRLAEKQAATTVDVVAARNKIRQAELQIEGLEKRRAALVGRQDRTVAQARLKDALAAVELARQRIAQTVFSAPMAGVVYQLSVRPGDYVDAGGLIANVGETSQLRVRVYVDEPELGRVAVGQPVRITWDGLPGKIWEGTVERMPSEIVPLGSRQVGEVKCTIANPGKDLVPGSNVNADIRTNMVNQALSMPKEALRRDANGAGVFLLNGDTVVWRKVKTGASNVTRVQAVEGLNEGDAVALPTDLVLHDGQKVAPTFP
jgi:HlyD family secretion protein